MSRARRRRILLDNLSAAHIHALAPGAPLNASRRRRVGLLRHAVQQQQCRTNSTVTPFAGGVGGVFTGVWNAPEGNAGTTLTAQLANLFAEQALHQLPHARVPGGRDPRRHHAGSRTGDADAARPRLDRPGPPATDTPPRGALGNTGIAPSAEPGSAANAEPGFLIVRQPVSLHHLLHARIPLHHFGTLLIRLGVAHARLAPVRRCIDGVPHEGGFRVRPVGRLLLHSLDSLHTGIRADRDGNDAGNGTRYERRRAAGRHDHDCECRHRQYPRGGDERRRVLPRAVRVPRASIASPPRSRTSASSCVKGSTSR